MTLLLFWCLGRTRILAQAFDRHKPQGLAGESATELDSDRLRDALRAAEQRGIVVEHGGQLQLSARSLENHSRPVLKEQFLAALPEGQWVERGDAIRAFARWMGFRRAGSAIQDTAQSLINGLLREKRLERDGTRIRKLP